MKIDETRPAHYGGENDPYEPIKVIDAWGLGFNLGNVVKYIARLGKKDDPLKELLKARTYLEFEIRKQQGIKEPAEEVESESESEPYKVGGLLGYNSRIKSYMRFDGVKWHPIPDLDEYLYGISKTPVHTKIMTAEGEVLSEDPVLSPAKQAETSDPEDRVEDDFEGHSKLPRTGTIPTPTREQLIAGSDSPDSTEYVAVHREDRDYRFSKKKLQQLADREVQIRYVNGSREMVADIIRLAGLAMDSGFFISDKPDGMYYRRIKEGLSVIPWSYDKGIESRTPEDFLI